MCAEVGGQVLVRAEELLAGSKATCRRGGAQQANGSSLCRSVCAAAAQKGLIQADLSALCACCHRRGRPS